jgi:hypothetical protein
MLCNHPGLRPTDFEDDVIDGNSESRRDPSQASQRRFRPTRLDPTKRNGVYPAPLAQFELRQPLLRPKLSDRVLSVHDIQYIMNDNLAQ